MTHLAKCPGRRPGTVLLIVLTLLTLFAVVGLAFVFYADSEANAAKLTREGANRLTPDIEPELAAALFLSQLCYGTNDPASIMYQQDLARNMTLVPYTYPDLNNAFLAAYKAEGMVLARSFVRPGLATRPDPAKHAGFPPMEDSGGDVRNVQYRPGVNDSIWIDPNFPVMTAPNGIKYKPLIAVFILDLDSLVNLNAPGKANVSKVLNADDQEWRNLGPTFPPSNLEALFRFGDTGSPARGSQWYSLLPKNLADPRRRRMVTSESSSRVKAGTVNINRPLTNDKDRQDLAWDLYQILLRSTGTPDPNIDLNYFLSRPEFQQARKLAQLAANLVDYRDEDNDITRFQWIKGADFVVSNYVYGTEKPPLVINELYVQYDNASDDTGIANVPAASQRATSYKLNVWLELLNPGTTPVDLSAYQILICDKDAKLLDADNLTGAPKGKIFGKMNLGSISAPVAGQSYLTVGSGAGNFLPQRSPNLTMAASSGMLSCSLSLTDISEADVAAYKPTILLRRLAKAGIPANDPKEPGYNANLAPNPYITIDYVQDKMWDNREFVPAKRNGTPLPTTFASTGRQQPYAATVLVAQTGGAANQPKNTFTSGNTDSGGSVIAIGGGDPQPTPGPSVTPNAYPLVWIDGPLSSPLDLLQAPSCRSQELTQLVGSTTVSITGLTGKFYVDWLKDNSRLFSVLESIRITDPPAGGREPGKINLNTLWDPELFDALCNHPRSAELWSRFAGRRTPNLLSLPFNPFSAIGPSVFDTASGTDRPFVGLGAPVAFNGVRSTTATSINNTILAGANITPYDPAGPRLFGLPGATPSEQWQLLMKLNDNFTTRSNAFAVWATIGFFEVVEDRAPPTDSYSSQRHNFVFVIDTTGSMSADDGLKSVKSSLALLVSNLRPDDQVEIITYDNQAYLKLGPTSGSDKQKIQAALDALQAVSKGGDNDVGALQMAYQVADQNFIPNAVNRIILCTDGVGQTTPTKTMLDAVQAATNKGITLSTLGYTAASNSGGPASLLTQYANLGAGQFSNVNYPPTAQQSQFIQQGAGPAGATAKAYDPNAPVKFGAEIGRSEGRHLRHRFFAIIDRTDLRIPVLTPPTLASASKPGAVTIAGRTFDTALGPKYTVQVGDFVVVDANQPAEEAATVTGVSASSFTLSLQQPHASNAPVVFRGPWPVVVSPRNDPNIVRFFSVID